MLASDISVAIPAIPVHTVCHLSPSERATLDARGWISLQGQASKSHDFKLVLLGLGQSLGTPVPTRSRSLVDELTALNKHEANPCSLSRITGTGQQPWHMDLAHRMEPARYLVMGMHEAGTDTACTELLDASTLIPKILQAEALSEPFLVRTGARSFYATMSVKGQPFLRFDPGCMQGATTRAKTLMQKVLDQDLAPSHTHRWGPRSVLVIDNWRMLHRRADAANSANRTLYRVCVMGGTV